MINRMSAEIDFQAQALTLRGERQRLIASNIANADTPGYVARDFDFAQALREASGSGGGGFKLADNAGLSGARPAAGGERAPRLTYATSPQNSLDGNTVDMDRERASFLDNALRYESTVRFIASSVKTALEAMRSHHQG